jgi:hypothetical protein
MSQTQTYRSWSGYAFESGMRDIAQLKKALNIENVFTRSAAYTHPGKNGIPGIPIDLIIDRDDYAIRLCELKFYQERVSRSKTEVENLLTRRSAFRYFTKTQKILFWTVVSPCGTSTSQNNQETDQSLTTEVFFLPS